MHVEICQEKKSISYVEGMYRIQLDYETEDQLLCIESNLRHCRSIQEIIALSTDVHKMCTLSGMGIDWQEADIRLENACELHMSLGLFGRDYMRSVIYPLQKRYGSGDRTDDLYYKIMAMTPGA